MQPNQNLPHFAAGPVSQYPARRFGRMSNPYAHGTLCAAPLKLLELSYMDVAAECPIASIIG